MKPKLLIVDDEVSLRELYRLDLADEGYEVHTAANSKEAMAMLADEKYEVIIVDIQMPGMFGIDLLQNIKAKDRHQSVIVNTSHAVHQENFMTWAAEAYVVKSFSTDELKRAIRNVLANQS
jgi:DNA-binding response OmpR family regulator